MDGTEMYSNRIVRSAVQINDAMIRVYYHMFFAVLTSMVVSALIGYNHAAMELLFGTPIKWLIIFAPLAAVFGITWALNNDPPLPIALILLHGFAAIMGLSMSTIFVTFTLGSIFVAFIGAATLFGVMSLYGYFTGRSLDGLGQFMFVGLIAIIIVSLINIWLSNSVLQMVIAAISVIIFAGLTAYDTQKIREEVSYETENNTSEIRGALSLYLDFINMFISLLQLFGDRK
jgi:FtsH-binding integral membrane protein